MQGFFVIKERKHLSVQPDQGFGLNTTKLPGKLLHEYHLETSCGEIGKHSIRLEGFLLIQHRDVQEEDIYYIHPYGQHDARGFTTLGEAVGVLINEIIGETNA